MAESHRICADFIYAVTCSFPTEERFGLISQLRRSAVSVSSNIAEGSSRSSDTDLARFIEIAYGSLLESVSGTGDCKKTIVFKRRDFQAAYNMAENLSKMLSGFRRTLKKRS